MKTLTVKNVEPVVPSSGHGLSCVATAPMQFPYPNRFFVVTIRSCGRKTTAASHSPALSDKMWGVRFMKTVLLLAANLNRAPRCALKRVLLSCQPLRPEPSFGGSGSSGGDGGLAALGSTALANQNSQAAAALAWAKLQQHKNDQLTKHLAKQAINQQRNQAAAAATVAAQQKAEADAAAAADTAKQQTALAEAQQQVKDTSATTTAATAAQNAAQQAAGGAPIPAIAQAKSSVVNPASTAPGLDPFSAALATSGKVGNQFYVPQQFKFGGS